MAWKRKVDPPPPRPGPSRPRRESSLEEKLTLVYVDRAVHQGFLRKEQDQYIRDQGFPDLSFLLWSEERLKPDQLYQFIRNFNAVREATRVGGRDIS